jgi:hypothetical protein
MLRQSRGPEPQAKRDELADSLMARVISARRTAPGDHAIHEIMALVNAGRPTRGPGTGPPEPRALNWLIKVHREAVDPSMRVAALQGMIVQVTPNRALPYLREVAVSPDRTAAEALRLLAHLTTEGSPLAPEERVEVMNGLRDLWERQLVRDEAAQNYLARMADRSGWRFPPGATSPPPDRDSR